MNEQERKDFEELQQIAMLNEVAAIVARNTDARKAFFNILTKEIDLALWAKSEIARNEGRIEGYKRMGSL